MSQLCLDFTKENNDLYLLNLCTFFDFCHLELRFFFCVQDYSFGDISGLEKFLDCIFWHAISVMFIQSFIHLFNISDILDFRSWSPVGVGVLPGLLPVSEMDGTFSLSCFSSSTSTYSVNVSFSFPSSTSSTPFSTSFWSSPSSSPPPPCPSRLLLH